MPAGSSTPVPHASERYAHQARSAARFADALISTSVHTALAVSAAPNAKRTQLFMVPLGM